MAAASAAFFRDGARLGSGREKVHQERQRPPGSSSSAISGLLVKKNADQTSDVFVVSIKTGQPLAG